MRENKKSILQVIDAMDMGGAQQFLLLLAEFTPKDAYDITLCVLQPKTGLLEGYEQEGVRVVCFNRERPSIVNPIKFVSYAYNNIRDMYRICREHNVEIVHCHLSDAEFLGIAAAKLARVKSIVATVHTPGLLDARSLLDPRNFLRRVATMLVYNRADWITAVSEETLNKLVDVFWVAEKKLKFLANGIDVEHYKHQPRSEKLLAELNLPPESKIVSCVGRLMPPKGQLELLDAMPEVIAAFPRAQLLLVGDGDLRSDVEEKISTLQLTHNVRMLGNRNDVDDILAITDVYVLPSLWEGTSLALLEAMAAAKPIVATDIPGTRHVIEQQKHALMVPPADAKAMAQAILTMLREPESGARMGECAYQTVKAAYDIRHVVSELETLYLSKANGQIKEPQHANQVT